VVACLAIRFNRMALLIIRLIVQTILLYPSEAVWTDGPSNVSRPDPSGAVQVDAEHPSRNRKVVGSNPTSGSPISVPGSGGRAVSRADEFVTASHYLDDCPSGRLPPERSLDLASSSLVRVRPSTMRSLAASCAGCGMLRITLSAVNTRSTSSGWEKKASTSREEVSAFLKIALAMKPVTTAPALATTEEATAEARLRAMSANSPTTIKKENPASQATCVVWRVDVA
jgi:hypothetical protein